jgi:hypothetical protein
MRRNPTLGDGAVVGQNTPGSQPQALGNTTLGWFIGDLDCAKGPPVHSRRANNAG